VFAQALILNVDEMKNLAPEIYRQRLIVEGLVSKPITSEEIISYLSKLSPTLDMTLLNEPVTHQSPLYGWAGWVHWETSGAHFYAWDQPRLFFSVDIYTCKKFSTDVAVQFTRDFFSATEIAFNDIDG
jgi:S-adenosylmethionine decarboxylase